MYQGLGCTLDSITVHLRSHQTRPNCWPLPPFLGGLTTLHNLSEFIEHNEKSAPLDTSYSFPGTCFKMQKQSRPSSASQQLWRTTSVLDCSLMQDMWSWR